MDQRCWCDSSDEELKDEVERRVREVLKVGMTVAEAKPRVVRAMVVFNMEVEFAMTREAAEEMYDNDRRSRA